jgi:DNA primase
MAQGQPPCHKSKSGRSFSVNLSHGGWYCFGCGQHGDQIQYVMLRDGCDFQASCKTLGIWRDRITPQERLEITRREHERRWNRRREQQAEETRRRLRLSARARLHMTADIYREADATLHRLGPVPEAEPYWAILPPALDVLRIEESEYCRAAGLENPYE